MGWQKDIAAKVKRQQEKQKSDSAKFIETQRIKKEFGPTLWQAVLDEAESSCVTINRQVGNDVVAEDSSPPNSMVFRNTNHPGRQLSAKFDPEKALLLWKVEGLPSGATAGGQYEVAVDNRDGKAKFYAQGPRGEPLFAPDSSASDIVKQMMSVLLRD